MQNLFLAVLLTVLLFIVFRYFKKFKINSFHAVVINYYVCIITGIVFLNNSAFIDKENISINLPWVKLGIYTGLLFVPTFYLMALTVEKVNISVATVANKMSLVIPILFSLIFLKRGPTEVSAINIAGVLIALLAIVMTSAKQGNIKRPDTPRFLLIILPAALFILGGIIDTLINYTNYTYLHGEYQTVFPLILFATASITGTVFIVIKAIIKKSMNLTLQDIAGGIILGIPNYFSLYFLLRTLSDYNNDAALVYPVVNIGIIIVASLLAVVLFKEKLSIINLTGICFSVISIILVFW